ncbi:fluoride efflux transporter FluC [Alkalicoccobacillus porphyridii]|uniref:Fluoride-specific ion channel FluC n=1 Tax=Alkalicoccobacillus porphyridii TaxID=2597270 RepID=A0A553ZU03_9BACI|nr:CrcB family protein [Alkalicoccobacillus porphyridii]TSB44942.1 CrcB family protein [Alkalicoccobacillus porphyridii]
MQWKTIAAVAIAGAIGTCVRYLLQLTIQTDHWLNVTLIVNLSGSLLLGILSGWLYIQSQKEWIRIGLGVGFCGGFTTMSTFAAESIQFFNKGSEMIPYVAVSMFAGVAACGCGIWIGTYLSERRKTRI